MSANRSYTFREDKLLTEWIALNYPGVQVIQHYRINLPPPFVPPGWSTAEVVRLLKPTAFMVDAVVLSPMGTILVEAKVDNESQAIGQLVFYAYLIKKYQTLQEFAVDPLLLKLVYARPNDNLKEFAGLLGVDAEIYSPTWIQTYLRTGLVG